MKTIVAALGAIAIGSAVMLTPLFEGGTAEDGDGKARSSLRDKKKRAKKSRVKKSDGRRRLRNIKISRNRPKRGGIERGRARDDEEANLTPEQREILNAIRNASENEDRRALVRLVQKLQRTEGWPGSVPLLIRTEAIDALGWMGSRCLPEIIGFLSDPDEDIVRTASSNVSDAVSDVEIGDRERSRMLLMAAQVVNDPDTMESILFELNNMRNSVAADTIEGLWKSSNSTTRSLLAEAIESVTGEEGIDTPQKLKAWLSENQDDEGDEEFYGRAHR